jgi:hypothetical protein
MSHQPVCARRNRAFPSCVAFAAVLFMAISSLGAAEGDPMMLAMKVMKLSPAIASDGKSVAMHSMNPGAAADAAGSLAVFDARGKEKRRLPLVPPARDAARSAATYKAADAVLVDGGYKRMGRLARSAEKTVLKGKPSDPPPSCETTLDQDELSFDVKVTVGKILISAKREGRKVAEKLVTFRTPRARCAAVTGYSVAPAKAGYDRGSGLLALSLYVENSGTICFSHEVVWTVK